MRRKVAKFLLKQRIEVYKARTPTNALFIKLDRVLEFILKITLTSSYKFRSTTIIRESSLEPG